MKQLTKQDIEWTITPEEEHSHWTDESLGYDAEVQECFNVMAEAHGLWGWCSVKVTGKYKGILVAHEYLGCCSYADEQAFKSGGYYEQMQDDVIDSLNSQLTVLFGEMCSHMLETLEYVAGHARLAMMTNDKRASLENIEEAANNAIKKA